MEIGSLAQWASVFMNVVVAILAIWGDKFRAALTGPQIEISLRPGMGVLDRKDGKRLLFHHIDVRNIRRWRPAENVCLRVADIARRRPDGTYASVPLIVQHQLLWAYFAVRPRFPTIAAEDTCDLGVLDEAAARFNLAVFDFPRGYPGYVAAGEAIRVKIVVLADNFQSRRPLHLEIHWDGQWADLAQMDQHLTIQQVIT